MDVKPEDLSRRNNFILERRGTHPNTIDETFSCRNERCGGTIGTVTGTRPASGLRQRGHCSDRRVASDNPLDFDVLVNIFLFHSKDANPNPNMGESDGTKILVYCIRGAFIVMGSEITCEAKPYYAVILLPSDATGPREVFRALL